MSFSSSQVATMLGALLVFLSIDAHAASWEANIKRDDWVAHVAERRLLELDAIREILARFEEIDDARIVIQFPGGDVGSAWAVQFRDRLVAYGVPSAFMEMMPGSGGLDILRISLTDDR